MTKLPISPRRTAERLAFHLAALATEDERRQVSWSVAGADLSRWTRWRLRRALQRLAPEGTTVEVRDDVHGRQDGADYEITVWVTFPSELVYLLGDEMDLGLVRDSELNRTEEFQWIK